jgi:hypothetical protein
MDPDARASLDRHLARVYAQRSEMRESAAALDDALEHPLGAARWRERVHTALIELAHDFRDHVELSESAEGLFRTVLEEDVRLSPAVERQRAEHVVLGDRLDEAIEALEGPDGSGTDLRTVREELTCLIGDLVRHRQRGNDLVYEAFTVDLGGRG